MNVSPLLEQDKEKDRYVKNGDGLTQYLKQTCSAIVLMADFSFWYFLEHEKHHKNTSIG